MNADCSLYVGTYSNADTPPHTAVYDCDGRRLQWVERNAIDDPAHPYYPWRNGLPEPEFVELRAEDGQVLHGVLLKPRDFDAGRRWPAIAQVYGGPGRQKVTRAWRAPAERLLLDAGFLVFQLDNRGTANRGLAFEAPIHRGWACPRSRTSRWVCGTSRRCRSSIPCASACSGGRTAAT
jgi:dipeptidyl-peptidase-4